MRHLQSACALILAVFALQGCETLDRKPETIHEALYVSAEYGRALALSVNEARDTGVLDRETHQEALDTLQDVLNGIQTALDAHRVGNYSKANSTLDQIEAGLRSVALLLARYEQ